MIKPDDPVSMQDLQDYAESNARSNEFIKKKLSLLTECVQRGQLLAAEVTTEVNSSRANERKLVTESIMGIRKLLKNSSNAIKSIEDLQKETFEEIRRNSKEHSSNRKDESRNHDDSSQESSEDSSSVSSGNSLPTGTKQKSK